jgi:DNA repair protein RadA/Sms
MAKISTAQKVAFVCTDCGAQAIKWMGKCTACGAFGTVKEFRPGSGSGSAKTWAGATGGFVTLAEAGTAASKVRALTGISELDRVLGGGVEPGTVVLLGGEPGAGKSTVLLQVAGALAGEGVAYLSGEESAGQIASRARRLGVAEADIRVWAGNNLEEPLEALAQNPAKFLVVDSIQTVYLPGVESGLGSVSQVRECAATLVRMAKETGTVVFLVGHVTKTGDIAGPRILEHMVDVVLYFEGDSTGLFRMVRAIKNRMGASNEVGVFRMGESGLESVDNPSELFLTVRDAPVPGTCVFPSMEGDRPILAEVQSLVEDTPSPNPKRFASGIDVNRVQMLLAVLNRHGALPAFDQNMYVKVVGGMRVQEAAADLAVLLSTASTLRNTPLPDKLAAFGEVGLAGEIRPVPRALERCKESKRQGFTSVMLPDSKEQIDVPGLEIIRVKTVAQALKVFRR